MGVQSHPKTRGDFERLLKMLVCSKLACWWGDIEKVLALKKQTHITGIW